MGDTGDRKEGGQKKYQIKKRVVNTISFTEAGQKALCGNPNESEPRNWQRKLQFPQAPKNLIEGT